MNALPPIRQAAQGGRSVRRTLDPSTLNRAANHPAVRPWLSGEGEIDLGPLLQNVANIGLVTDGGGFFLQQLTPGEYEAHSIFEPQAHRSAIRAMREGLEYLFTHTDCVRVVTKVPHDNKAALGLARVGGFKKMFGREKIWNGGGVDFYGLALDDWAQNNPSLEVHGERFHARLEEAKRAAGSELPKHDDDAAHERAVGAAFLMFRAGRVTKATEFYNRWAVFAGYAPIRLVTEAPPVLDVGDAVIEIFDGEMEVLECR